MILQILSASLLFLILWFSSCNVNSSFGRTDNMSTENLFSGSAVKSSPKGRIKEAVPWLRQLFAGFLPSEARVRSQISQYRICGG
jgi:hypothetical protein